MCTESGDALEGLVLVLAPEVAATRVPEAADRVGLSHAGDQTPSHTGPGALRQRPARIRVSVRHDYRFHQCEDGTDRRAILPGGRATHRAMCPSDGWQPAID
jgi:hypothetical protein